MSLETGIGFMCKEIPYKGAEDSKVPSLPSKYSRFVEPAVNHFLQRLRCRISGRMVANRLVSLGQLVIQRNTRKNHVLPCKIHHFYCRKFDQIPGLALAKQIVVQEIAQ